ncbi:MAG TPA: type I DNA topoisomerase [Acidimicrobiales bacterium]|nr:type I DNA topoisomerase [Acidimicrobiales bacterium]
MPASSSSRSRRSDAGKPLVIVESPAKARTIASLLGPDFVVESSVGHIRDLPRRANEVPPAYKSEGWARLGVDVDNGFKPLYVVAAEKRPVVTRLKQLVKDASELYLATDEDREGESIAWHLTEVLAPRVPVKRMVFHEITPAAIQRAVEEWRDLDRRLVDAQEARRILDRLYGYEVSPVLWKKVMPRLSAGRVQSVATRMIVERERARMRFRSATWWDLEGSFVAAGSPFAATLVAVGGTPIATGRDFDESGRLTKADVRLLDESEAGRLARGLAGQPFTVRSVTEKPYRRSPAPPFMTSTLQQEAGRKLRFGAQRTMQVAQGLYEQGWITYMRTDSTTLSDEALAAARSQATALYGASYVPDKPRRYERKVKNAQEAHEAIRPAGEVFRTPDEAGRTLHGDALRLYDLVWKRTVASQMADATGTSAQVRLVGVPALEPREEAEFQASGTVITFPGFLQAYVEGSDDADAEASERDVHLPRLAEGDPVSASEIEPRPHTTQPPARYTEASLVKSLEELGVGRPSTYASILGTIQNRGYVWKKGTALVPSFTAFAVVGLLERYFADLVDYGFTAAMEDDLDDIAQGEQEALPWLTRFYFGEDGAELNGEAPSSGRSTTSRANGSGGNGQSASGDDGHTRRGLKEEVASHLGEIDAREINSIGIGSDAQGNPLVVRVGRYGPYLQRGEERASIPEDLPPDELTIERAEELLAAPSGDRTLGTDPESGLPVLVRSGRFGPYVQLGEVTDNGPKPRTASLFSNMSPDTVTLPEALELLQLPRLVGIDPSTSEEIHAHNGRFGPYLKKGTDTRSLESEPQLLTVTVDEALALFAQPKLRRGRTTQAPLRELGEDPESGGAIVVRSGRYGPYVTDGTTNASLRKGDSPEAITLERAAELIAERRAAGPPPKRAGRVAKAAKKTAKSAKKTAAKKTAAKKTAAKKTAAKKTTAKKTTAKKTTATKAVADDVASVARPSTDATASADGTAGSTPQVAPDPTGDGEGP